MPVPMTTDATSGVVLACGLATLDVVQTLERVPAANEKVVATDLLVAAGGPAANAAVTAALLGVPARLVTRVGGGALGAAVTGDLRACGVEVVDLAPDGATPPVSTVLVTRSTGERAVVSVNARGLDGGGPGGVDGREAGAGGDDAGAAGRSEDDAGAAGRSEDGGTDAAARVRAAGWTHAAVWDGVTVLLVDGHHLDLAEAFAREARRRGVLVVLDGGSWKPGLERLLGVVDIAVLSADFAVPDGVGLAGRDAGADGAGVEGAGVDGAGVEGAGVEGARVEGARVEGARVEGARVEGARVEGAGVEGARVEGARVEGAGVEGARVHGAGADEALRAVERAGPRVVAQSHGPAPIRLLAGTGPVDVDVPAAVVVDTLGAGDVLHGALAAWLARHGDDDVRDALSWAARLASASCEAPGARGWAEEPRRVGAWRAELAGAQ